MKTKPKPKISDAEIATLPADFGKLPELPSGGPRPLTAKDLEGFSKAEWKAIQASIKPTDKLPDQKKGGRG